jgi:hypothetical protein
MVMDECYTLENDPDFINNTKSTDIRPDYFKLVFNKLISLKCYQNIIKREYRYEKSFIRFELVDNDPITFTKAMEEISNIIVKIHNDIDSPKFTISLRLNLILLEEYGLNVELINVKELLSQYTKEEIDNKFTWTDNKDRFINTKYSFNNENGFYIDIPLLNEFYNFESLINEQEELHGTIYQLNWDKITLKYFKNITIGYEKITRITKYSTPISLDHTIERITALQYPLLLNQNRLDWIYITCKNIYVIICKNNNAVLLQPNNAIIYNFDDYIVYKINVINYSKTFIEFDNIESLFGIHIITTRSIIKN